ncbi:MAG: acetyl-CoA carboxylase biotin carboxyl carrier protein subunit [Magnetovibrio sp.]|nr:acetyl-CoA carboxylase biotin carboxyl carrier protein subunit [Magnetovibrio sp.]
MAKTPKSKIDEDLVRQLAALLDETGLSEIEYGQDGLSVRVAKHGAPAPAVAAAPLPAAPAPAAAEAASGAEESALADHPGALTAPMVGVVYTAPDPDTPAFVQEGDEVKEGQTLFLIEAMKVFNPITAPRAGRVSRILVGNETPVEFGEPLAIIE